MKRANILLATLLHLPLPLPCLPTHPLLVLLATSVVDSTLNKTVVKSTKHLKLQRKSCKSEGLVSTKRNRMQRKLDHLCNLSKEKQHKSNLLVMQVLSLHPLAPHGLSLVLALTGTLIQVHHHISPLINTGFAHIHLMLLLSNSQTTQQFTLQELDHLSFN